MTYRCRNVVQAWGLLLLLVAPAILPAQELTSVFNGEDLEGWRIEPEGENRWWKVEDHAIKLQNGPEKKGSNLWTQKEYGNFIMEFDFRMGKGTVDTGIFMRGDHDQIQIGISGSLKRDMTGSPYIPGKGYPVEAKGVAELLKVDDWNQMTIVAKGSNYCVWLNGKHVMTYDSESAIEKGPIGIQLHGGREMSAYYRNIRLAELN